VLLREEPGGGVLAIAQPAHAALAGQLAAAWDDDLSPAFHAAATHHDDVWAARDAAPPLSTATGRPQTFLELSIGERVAVWAQAPAVAAPLGAEGELWVLRHALRLHANYAEAPVQAMTARLGGRVDALVAELRAAQPVGFDDLALARGTSLLALFDTLSLRLCFGVTESVDAGVLRLAPAKDSAVSVAPWPFAGRRVEATFAARALAAPFPDQASLDAAWAAAAPSDVPVVLVPPT
jgi:Protein of unknown function (DUF3891)